MKLLRSILFQTKLLYTFIYLSLLFILCISIYLDCNLTVEKMHNRRGMNSLWWVGLMDL